MSPRNGTVVPGRRTSPVGGLRDQNPSAFGVGVDVVAVCPSYTALDRWRSSFPGRRHSYLERSPTPCNVRTISASLLLSLSSGVPSRDFCSACEVTLSLLDTLIVLVTYLLTYLCPVFDGIEILIPGDSPNTAHLRTKCEILIRYRNEEKTTSLKQLIKVEWLRNDVVVVHPLIPITARRSQVRNVT